MDEMEKYKHRLEVIAEKRRLQEEEDKVKREKEEERIKQRQLKRKSLREQWLMDPAPLSPTYQNPQSPTRSEGENTEEEDPEKQVEDGQTVRTLHARPHTRCTDTKRGAGFCVEQAFYIVLY
ncbi:Paralemmin-3 [Oryzias melastigma]|uniref:Paralemmin-3 n=1 Tax=Oryzias melastigma TaxID=30732 RepID=A0A834BVF5_ORYME|nr:Paralemmin-3 [Oryzias melastigma]